MADIKIIDRTLVEMYNCDTDNFKSNAEKIREFSKLIYEIGADVIEVTPEIIKILNLVPADARYKVKTKKEVTAIRDCDLNLKGLTILPADEIRINGLCDVMLHDYQKFFEKLIGDFSNEIEMCFSNSMHLSTAAAYEWVRSGGKSIVTSFAGIGRISPLEEVIGVLQFIDEMELRGNLTLLPKALNLYQDIVGEVIPKNKPVIGIGIFDVESGVHVDGILKNPKNFEPFEPSLIGRERCIVIGKFSGEKAIKIKLEQLNIKYKNEDVPCILSEVRAVSTDKMRGLLDSELFEICKKVGGING